MFALCKKNKCLKNLFNNKNTLIFVTFAIGIIVGFLPSSESLMLKKIEIQLKFIGQIDYALHYEIRIDIKNKVAINKFRFDHKKTKSNWNQSKLIIPRRDLPSLDKNLEFILIMANNKVLITSEFDILE